MVESLAAHCCPQCGSKLLYRDGLRYLTTGESIQRLLCRSCGFRFSDASKSYKECQTSGKRQICAIPQEAKNLATTALEPKAVETSLGRQDAKGKILSYLIHLQNNGYRETTIQAKHDQLFRLVQLGADLNDPESVKKTIASINKTESYKLLLCISYEGFANFNRIAWVRPHYKQNQKLPFIPYESELDALISGCGRKTSAFLRLLKETAMRRGEAWYVKWTDLDLRNNVVTCNNPEKNSNPRIFKISNELTAMLDQQRRKNQYVFGGYPLSAIASTCTKQRNNITRKLGNPRIREITLHTFRHFKATWLYHETKDILYVMKFLGHRNIKKHVNLH